MPTPPVLPHPAGQSTKNLKHIVWFKKQDWALKWELVDSGFPISYPDGYGKQMEGVKEVVYLRIEEVDAYRRIDFHVLSQDLCEVDKKIQGFLYQNIKDLVPGVGGKPQKDGLDYNARGIDRRRRRVLDSSLAAVAEAF